MKVTFQIEGGSPVVIECNAGENLLELARRANVAIDAPCSGNGSCGKCRVKLVEGTVESREYYGLYIKYFIHVGSQTLKVIEKNDGVNIYEAGQKVTVGLGLADVMSYPIPAGE